MGKMKNSASDPASIIDSSMPPPPPPLPISDALLFSTLCIVGLAVEVQMKDGSVYSGIFHAACPDAGYGIVLKKAKKIVEGSHNKNFAVGDLVDTLVVLSEDFVQVLVKDLVLPVKGIFGNFAGDGLQDATRTVETQDCDGDEQKEPDSFVDDNRSSSWCSDQKEETSLDFANNGEDVKVNERCNKNKALKNRYQCTQEVKDGRQDDMCLIKVEEPSPVPNDLMQERQVMEGGSNVKLDFCHLNDQIAHKLHCPSHFYTPFTEVNSADEDVVNGLSEKVSRLAGCYSPAMLPATSEALENRIMKPSLPISTNLAVPGNKTVRKANFKVSKLNPNAKIFFPSFTNSGSIPTTARAIANSDYMLNSYPMPTAGADPGIEMNSFPRRSTLPPKLLQFSNFVAGHNAVGAQGSQFTNVSHAGIRQQSARLGQYHPVQAGTPFAHPNSQAVVAGRLGQLVYMQPISQDGAQAPATIVSHGMAVPFIAPYQASMPKLQGTVVQPLQLCVNPTIVTGGNQPFALPSHIPFSQPLSAIRPFSVPGGNGIYDSTFHRT